MKKKCDECGGKIVVKKVPYEIYDIKVGDFLAEVCQNCGEICFSEEKSKKITQKTKERGLWGLERKNWFGALKGIGHLKKEEKLDM